MKQTALWQQTDSLSGHTRDLLFPPNRPAYWLRCGKQGMVRAYRQRGLPDEAGRTHVILTLPKIDSASDLQRNYQCDVGDHLTTTELPRRCHGACTQVGSTCWDSEEDSDSYPDH